MFVAPGRETFFAFPSSILGDKYTLTVFLPTEVAPISQHYPVVYFVGLDRSDREKFQQFAKENGVFLAGLFIPEEDMETVSDKLADFVSLEWIPYMDTNYATKATAANRILAASGEKSARAVMKIFANGNFGALSLLNPGTDFSGLSLQNAQRVYVRGTQEELAAAASVLVQSRQYGRQYAFEYADEDAGWLGALNMKYLLAAADDLKVKKLLLYPGTKTIANLPGKSISLRVYAKLTNGLETVFVPQEIRMSPPFLDWQPSMGMLRVRAGAELGSVKITVNVDNVENSAKILLKNNKKGS